MKTLGHFKNGNVMMECTPEEERVLSILAEVAAGNSFSTWVEPRDGYRVDADMVAALSAVTEWIGIKDRANLLRQMAQGIDAAIKTKASV